MKRRNTPNSPVDKEVFSIFLRMHHKADAIWDKVMPHLGDISDKIVLDLGCGYGSSFIEYLKRKHPAKRFIHLDADPRVFERKRLRVQHGTYIEYKLYDWSNDQKIVGDVHSIPLSNNSVDVINIEGLTYDNPLIDYNRLGGELRRVLKKDGLLVVDESFLVGPEDGFRAENDEYGYPVVWRLVKDITK